MRGTRFPFLLVLIAGIFPGTVLGQSQVCPANIDFSQNDISSWSAETGLIGGGTQNYPAPNTGVSTLPEYTLSATGVEVITSPNIDPFGGFTTIPVVNGYDYKYAVKLGSTATSFDLGSRDQRNPGGFRRAITYAIQVPAGPANVPYTMTYAYAMVLENGTHNSNQQPMFKATLTAGGSVIDCASPEYYLPTLNDAGNGPGGGSLGATLDSAEALAEGFTVSPRPFLSHAGDRNNNGQLLYDVWTKGWTEVTFDLSPYRGQTVTLTFEADNCIPGAHFAYAYVALRNSCAGLVISGPGVACLNTPATYSVPALAGATYQWTVPADWTIQSGAGTHEITVMPTSTTGNITVHEVNSCADLRAALPVSASPPTIAGRLAGDARVCAGTNSSPITLQGQQGHVVDWLSTTDGVNWNPLSVTATTYTAKDLAATTHYVALVQNGDACSIDTAREAIVTVDPLSRGGTLTPPSVVVCQGQQQGTVLSLADETGDVVKWLQSTDQSTWSDFPPPARDDTYSVGAITSTRYYRIIVKSGVCPEDTSTVAATVFEPTPYPRVNFDPLEASICYGDSVSLQAMISVGTSYSWSPDSSLSGNTAGGGTPPLTSTVVASPVDTTGYIFSITNEGCPNTRTDTIPVNVSAPIHVSAGNDTAIVAGQPLPLHAVVDNPHATLFSWTPATGLDFTTIADPIASLTVLTDTIVYMVKASDAAGCFGTDSILVAVFKTGADIFVPTAFTPNTDGMNDVLRPICVGIRQLQYFRVYNRWGKLVFSTHAMGAGWDGRIGGRLQPAGGYVFMASGTDFNGKTVFRKGSTLLIR